MQVMVFKEWKLFIKGRRQLFAYSRRTQLLTEQFRIEFTTTTTSTSHAAHDNFPRVAAHATEIFPKHGNVVERDKIEERENNQRTYVLYASSSDVRYLDLFIN